MKSNLKFYGFLLWLLCAIFFLYEFFLRVYTGSISIDLIREFSLIPSKLALIGSFYYLAYAVMQIPAGILLDKYGIQKMLSFSIAVCVMGVFLFSFSHSYYLLLAARLLMGVGSAFAFPSLLMIAVQYFSKRHYGAWMGATQIMGAIGPIAAGAPFVFLIYALHGSWRDALLIVGGLGILLLIITVIFSFKHGHKLLPSNSHYVETQKLGAQFKTFFSNKQAVFIAIFAFMSYASIPLLGTVWGVVYLQSFGFTQIGATKTISFLWLGLAIGSPLVGFVADTLKNYKLVLIFCTALGVVASIIIILFSALSMLWMGFLLFLLGLSGGAQTLSFALLARHVPKSSFGLAAGINNTAVMLGGLAVPLLVGVFIRNFALHKHYLVSMYNYHNFLGAFTIMPILFILSLLVASVFLKNEGIPLRTEKNC